MNETLKNILITIISLMFIFVLVAFLIWIDLEYWKLLLIGISILFIWYIVDRTIRKYYPNSKYCEYSKKVLEFVK